MLLYHHHFVTVHDVINAAGVNDEDLFNGQRSVVRIAEDVFCEDFLKCIDKSQVDVEYGFKSFSDLTQA